jgi:hypothetical protein
MTLQDLSSGLSPEKEKVILTAPTEPFWSENLLFAPYDPTTGIGMWLHLGTVPTEWAFWEDRVLLTLPGDQGVLTMWAYHRTPSEQKPGGANLFFRCIEPFRRWKVTFDGFAQHVSNEAMQGGLAPAEGRRKRLAIDLDIECAAPVWDAEASANSGEGRGDMTKQGWAKEHYEQMYRAAGSVRVDQETWPFDGIGWRDHSRGPRGGGAGTPWGGHVIAGGLWPSGRSVIFSRYWTPDGAISLEGANVTEPDGTAHSAQVVDAPRLTELVLKGEKLKTKLRYANGQVDLTLTCEQSIWTSMPNQLAVGVDLSGAGLMYVLNYGPCEWDGEIGHMYIERSDPLSLPPIILKEKRGG